MTMVEAYNESVKCGLHSMMVFLQLAIVEKKMFKWEDDFDKVGPFIRDEFTEEWNQEVHFAGRLLGYWG